MATDDAAAISGVQDNDLGWTQVGWGVGGRHDAHTPYIDDVQVSGSVEE